MAIQTPLNHFLTDLHKPNETSLQVLEGNIASLKLKSRAYEVAKLVSYAALVAIIATVLAVSYNLLTLTGIAPILMAGLIITSPALFILTPKLAQWSNQYASLAEQESKTLLKLHEIQNWGSIEIDQFFERHQIDINRVDLNALRQVNRQEPKKALLPLIARYNVMEERIRDIRQSYERKIGENQRIEPNENPEHRQTKQRIRFENQCMLWETLEKRTLPTVENPTTEKGALPSAIDAATMLYLIENPTTTDIDVLPLDYEIQIPGVGTCTPKNYPERLFGKNNPPVNDDYFVFLPQLNRRSVTHAELEALQMNPDLIKQRLYPRAQ